jgi:hypothetical protein
VPLYDTVLDTAARCQHCLHQIIASRGNVVLAGRRAIAAQQDQPPFQNSDQASQAFALHDLHGRAAPVKRALDGWLSCVAARDDDARETRVTKRSPGFIEASISLGYI